MVAAAGLSGMKHRTSRHILSRGANCAMHAFQIRIGSVASHRAGKQEIASSSPHPCATGATERASTSTRTLVIKPIQRRALSPGNKLLLTMD